MRSPSFSMRSILAQKGGWPAGWCRTLAAGLRAWCRLLAAGEPVDDRLQLRRIQVLVEIVVDLDHWRVDAATQALDLDQGEVPVGCGFLEADPEFAPAGLGQLVGAAQPAGRGPANLEKVPTHGRQIEHAVEGGDLVDPDRGHGQSIGDVVHGGTRQPAADLALGKIEQRQDRARLTAGGIAGNDLFGQRLVGGREGECFAHLSISPKTTSMEPRMATVSASM